MEPLLPIKVGIKEAVESVQKILKEKEWHDFQIATLKLTLVPYFLFEYHYYREKDDNGEKIVTETKDGSLVFNGLKLIIDKETGELLKKGKDEFSTDRPDIEHEQVKARVGDKEIKEVIRVKTAEFFKVGRENVTISSIKKIFVPKYESFVTVKEGTFDVKINAFDGEIDGVQKVPVREKGFMEITKETLEELQDPKAWLEYSKGLVAETGKMVGGSSQKAVESGSKVKIDISVLGNRWLILIVIVLAIILIYFGLAL